MRLVLVLIAAIGLAESTAFPVQARSTLVGDLPQAMNCGESFSLTAQDYSPSVGGSCPKAIAQVNAQIDQLTNLLGSRCDGTLEISADTYTPAQGKCGGNAASGFEYGRQRTVRCVCSGNSKGMPANSTVSPPRIP